METPLKICRCVGCKRDPNVPCKGKGHHHDEHEHRHDHFHDASAPTDYISQQPTAESQADGTEINPY